jgi:hypothetical protein
MPRQSGTILPKTHSSLLTPRWRKTDSNSRSPRISYNGFETTTRALHHLFCAVVKRSEIRTANSVPGHLYLSLAGRTVARPPATSSRGQGSPAPAMCRALVPQFFRRDRSVTRKHEHGLPPRRVSLLRLVGQHRTGSPPIRAALRRRPLRSDGRRPQLS